MVRLCWHSSNSVAIPNSVRLFEVGARDGLQNERATISVAAKIELIERLVDAGLRNIEAGSFVSPQRVPQMADSDAVFRGIRRQEGVRYSALTPNLRGIEAAIMAGVDEVAVFSAASESFSQKNFNCSIDESLERFIPVMQVARQNNLRVRGYVSCVLGCPYEGDIDVGAVADVAGSLHEMGCYEISLGDTIGVGTPRSTQEMIEAVSQAVPIEKLAVHFHDTYGQGLTNIYAALQLGIASVDSSVSGLGGCPYADGATGNVATEEVVYMLDGMGIDHGVDLNALIRAGAFINSVLGRTTRSRVAQALSGLRD